jgi:hypothetical protein
MLMKLLALAAAGTAAVMAAAPAAAVDFNTYNISFTNGTAIVMPTPARTTPGEYQDTYVFTLSEAGTFSGSLTTQRLRDPAGDIVSDLDFGNSIDGVSIDGGIPFDLPLAGSDGLEVVNLGSTLLQAGTHYLVVNYTVQTASSANAASYAGPINFAPAVASVPEPATWAMFVGAFGAIGGVMRRRRSTRVSFA